MDRRVADVKMSPHIVCRELRHRGDRGSSIDFLLNPSKLAGDPRWRVAVLRVVDRARATGLAEGRRLRRLLGLPGSSTRTQRTVRALLTGFFLYHLAGDEDYREFADPAARLPRTSLPDPAAPPVSAEDRIVALLR